MKETIEKIIKEFRKDVYEPWDTIEGLREILTNNLIEEEVNVDEKSPKFKIGDNAVYEYIDNEYIKIYEISIDEWEYEYNWVYNEEDLRGPSKEELNIYYK